MLFWPVHELNELYAFANWLCIWDWDCGNSSNWQLDQGHWKKTWFHHLLPVVSVTLYMSCDRWFLRFCVNHLCASWVRPTIPGVGRCNCTQGVLLLFSRLLFLSWAAWQAELEMSHWLLGTSCSLMGVIYCPVFSSKKTPEVFKNVNKVNLK